MNNKIDIIYDAMGALIKAECWEYLNDRFNELTLQAWRHDFDILIAYATATLPVKSKISNRNMFMDKCKELYPHDDWGGLE
jgi:hypothetical protein